MPPVASNATGTGVAAAVEPPGVWQRDPSSYLLIVLVAAMLIWAAVGPDDPGAPRRLPARHAAAYYGTLAVAFVVYLVLWWYSAVSTVRPPASARPPNCTYVPSTNCSCLALSMSPLNASADAVMSACCAGVGVTTTVDDDG
jgi:hypothetical protein